MHNGTDANVRVLMFSTRKEVAVAIYPDSGKVGVFTGNKEDNVMVRKSSDVGYYDEDGKFVYAGKVGTGFTEKMLDELRRKMEPLGRSSSPFERGAKAPAKAHFLEPKLVAQVAFTEWTRGGNLRHAAFVGLREDKPGRAVRREVVRA